MKNNFLKIKDYPKKQFQIEMDLKTVGKVYKNILLNSLFIFCAVKIIWKNKLKNILEN